MLDKDVPEKYYLSERIKPTILSNGTGGFKSNSEINQMIARPLTATMAKMHRACQDNYYTEDFLKSADPIEYLKQEFSKDELATKRIRKLTPEEAFELQGFSKNIVKGARSIGISEHQLYKEAGNAASVNVIYAILYYLFEVVGVLR
ncbi:hypothetical protein SDC9_185135 [bioreactor metagenome]|uniref:DNA (cytosine-5-)-methyltransferase n=1 Tax=bioreactor metagenome TaxID=1076179 RepID=A0A645HF02_9ZZZZ